MVSRSGLWPGVGTRGRNSAELGGTRRCGAEGRVREGKGRDRAGPDWTGLDQAEPERTGAGEAYAHAVLLATLPCWKKAKKKEKRKKKVKRASLRRNHSTKHSRSFIALRKAECPGRMRPCAAEELSLLCCALLCSALYGHAIPARRDELPFLHRKGQVSPVVSFPN